MEYVLIIVVAALVFGTCYLVDRGFTKHFRSQEQHRSGKAVRLSKRYGSFGLLLCVLGVAAIFAGLPADWVLIAGGALIIVMGVGLTAYYLSYAIFYDEDTFLFTTLGKKAVTCRYADIQTQQLYNNQGHLLIELHMADGSAVQIQSTMDGCFDFMDHAFTAWCRQTGRTEDACPFHDPANSCWFPPVEG